MKNQPNLESLKYLGQNIVDIIGDKEITSKSEYYEKMELIFTSMSYFFKEGYVYQYGGDKVPEEYTTKISKSLSSMSSHFSFLGSRWKTYENNRESIKKGESILRFNCGSPRVIHPYMKEYPKR